MVLFLLTGHLPFFLLICQVIMCYLTGYELVKETDLQFLWKAWWVLVVFLLNILGFALFWIWLLIRRTRRAARSHPD